MANNYDLPVNYNDPLIQEYLKYSNNALNAKRGAAQQSIDLTQSTMYDVLGRQQLQTERDIAKRRIQAQRAGLTSSQLAAQEMQNIMVGQMGAQQIAQQYRQESYALEQQYAGVEDENMAGLLSLLNQNRTTAASLDTQKFAASIIPQLQNLFPDATPEQITALSKYFLYGEDLTNLEQKALAELIPSLVKNKNKPKDTDKDTNKTKVSSSNSENSATTDFFKALAEGFSSGATY